MFYMQGGQKMIRLEEQYTCDLKEVQKMLTWGAPLSVITKTINLKMHDVQHLRKVGYANN